MIYFIPVGPLSPEAATILSRSEVAVLSDGNLVAKLSGTLGHATAIVQLNEDEMHVLVRNASHLLNDTPVILTAVPGLRYTSPWMQIGSRLHPVDWLTLEAALTKAGFMANKVGDLDSRAKRDDKVGNASRDTMSFFTDDDDEDEDRVSKPEFDEVMLDQDSV